MVEKAIPIKDKVQEALLNDKFNFVVVVKNPYSWYYCNKVYSEKIKKDGQTVLDKGYIDWYNERNNEYYQYYKTENKNTFIVRYEDFYYGGYPNVLKNIGDKFNLSPKQLPFKDLDGVVGFASTISPPGKHDMKKYEDSMLTVGNKTKPLEDHINSLEDDVVMIKGSDIGYDLDKFSFNRRVKVVYCLRNPRDVIDANIERKNYGFTYYFDRYCDFYDLMMDQCQVYPLITERIMIDSRSLLDYCGLFGMSDFSSIGTFKKRNASYIKHRAKSFFKKRLYD